MLSSVEPNAMDGSESDEERDDAEDRGDGDVAEAAEERDARGVQRPPAAGARQRRERHPVVGDDGVQRADRGGGQHDGVDGAPRHVRILQAYAGWSNSARLVSSQASHSSNPVSSSAET